MGRGRYAFGERKSWSSPSPREERTGRGYGGRVRGEGQSIKRVPPPPSSIPRSSILHPPSSTSIPQLQSSPPSSILHPLSPNLEVFVHDTGGDDVGGHVQDRARHIQETIRAQDQRNAFGGQTESRE